MEMEPNAEPKLDAAIPRGRHPMELLMKQKSDPAAFLKAGDIAEGEVLEKRGTRLFVDLGARGTGIIFGREYHEAHDMIKGLAPGDRIAAKVVEPDNEEGYVELSLREAGREKVWKELARLMAAGELVRLKVLEANRGGLILEHLGVSGFLPASQLSSEHYPRVDGGDKMRIHEELKKLVGQEFEVAVIDVNQDDEKVIFSEKTRETEAVKQRLAAYKVGDVIEGEVAGVVSFGAFVRFGDGLEGLIHISEIDWQLITNPADVLKSGERVRVKIIGIEGDKVSLSLKAMKEDPWSRAEEKYKKGGVVMGTVVKFNPFGVFVKLDPEIQGLVHISEFGSEANMKETLRLNEPHEFTILSVDAREHRLALGLAREEPQPSAEGAAIPESESTEPPGP
ncbi:MAG: hypothetical protein A3B37_01520 [Candidatus Sungbacteria bacterium RIFCSPLOWO2_01_FULL_59_16]|uniref:S1 motif domain-containing protein n=1 Tax=Candidatus Sungbacteria bacterium RIFCSPLOWO2_01_FULL_59_16 TaxID=1802280 RepID=A0A1G2LEE6_9BACT|nr:MAG: hypothetical protein A3B37_01520 [Candidatus Sungbacteria bacterium RIFCSPLOWO2_01_FULL_59_16]